MSIEEIKNEINEHFRLSKKPFMREIIEASKKGEAAPVKYSACEIIEILDIIQEELPINKRSWYHENQIIIKKRSNKI